MHSLLNLGNEKVFIIIVRAVTSVVLATINSQSLKVEEEGGIILGAVEPHLVTEFQVTVALIIATAAVTIDADALIFMLRATVLLRSALARILILVKVLINHDDVFDHRLNLLDGDDIKVFIIFVGTVTSVVLATINTQSLKVEEEGGIVLGAVEPHLVTEALVAIALGIATAAVTIDADALIFMLRATVLLRSALARILILIKVLINSDGGRSA